MDSETKKAWMEFQGAGLFWWINRSLHLFGWEIVRSYDKDTDEFLAVYPQRTVNRGFTRQSEDVGFVKLTDHIHENADRIKADLEEG